MTAPQTRTPDCNRASAETIEHADSNSRREQTEHKRFQTLRAKLALRGFELRRQANGTLRITRWNLLRECAGLSEVEQFASQAGAL